MLDWSKPAKKYCEMALEYGKLAGYKPNGFPLINRRDHPQEWRDWYAYYGFRRLFASQEIMRQKEEKTVPTQSPFDFDLDFHLIRSAPEVPRDGVFKEVVITPEMRARQQAIYASFSGRKVECLAPDRHKKSA